MGREGTSDQQRGEDDHKVERGELERQQAFERSRVPPQPAVSTHCRPTPTCRPNSRRTDYRIRRKGQFGREPNPEEVAERAGLSIDDARCIIKMARQPLSLDQPVGDHDDSYFGEFLEDHRDEDPLYDANQTALKHRIEEAM